VYIDPSQNGNDTIRIFIPAEGRIVKTDTANNIVQIKKPSEPSHKDTSSKQDIVSFQNNSPEHDSTVIKSSMQAPKPNVDIAAFVTPAVSENINSPKNEDTVVIKTGKEIKQQNQEVTQPPIIHQDSTAEGDIKPAQIKKDSVVVLQEPFKSSASNSDCKALADNQDFLKLRKKMASENSDDNMIKVAKRTFRSKCFSTEQIKNLSFLFLTNEGKYRFFDEAYAFASDSDRYFILQSQLTDSYYINRFRAMIHK
ncbi:MAG: DUF4476 domain-containing protein, partial [Ginsengibacter sp.]